MVGAWIMGLHLGFWRGLIEGPIISSWLSPISSWLNTNKNSELSAQEVFPAGWQSTHHCGEKQTLFAWLHWEFPWTRSSCLRVSWTLSYASLFLANFNEYLFMVISHHHKYNSFKEFSDFQETIKLEDNLGNLWTWSLLEKWEWPWEILNYASIKNKIVQLLSNEKSTGINIKITIKKTKSKNLKMLS